jgi:hypothetical protein
MVIRGSRKAEVYWWWLRKCTIWVQLLPRRWTPMIKFDVVIFLKNEHQCKLIYLKFWFESAFDYNFNFVVYLGYQDITCFSYRPSLRFKAQVLSTLYVRICESPIQTYAIGACWNIFWCIWIFRCKFGDLEKSRYNGDGLEIILCGYNFYHEDELRW